MSSEPNIFSIDAQASYMRRLGQDIADQSRKFALEKDPEALNPLKALESITQALVDSEVPQEYINTLDSIRDDPDVQEAVNIFNNALDGKADISTMVALVPQAEKESKTFLAFRDDPGLNGAVINNLLPASENVVSVSNYLSGAGTSFGGFMADLPSSLSDLSNGVTNASLFRFTKLQEQLDKFSGDLAAVIDAEDAFMKKYLIDSGATTTHRGSYQIDLKKIRSEEVMKKLNELPMDSKMKKLQQTLVLNAQVENAKLKHVGRLQAQKICGKVGAGMQGATAGFGVAMGVVDTIAGDQKLQNAEKKFQNGDITREQYDKEIRDGRLRLAQGTFGIGDGINTFRKLIVDKLDDKVRNASKGAKMGLRFASAVGGAFAIGMGITSVTKNAIAAHDAAQGGNVGRAAMYGVMAALDCVSVVLDGASVVCDFVPLIGQAVSAILDVVNTIVGIISMIIGIFADMVDTRTPEQKLREAMEEHINSDGFQTYLRNQEKVYKRQGYDMFELIVDAKALGISEEGADPIEVDKTIQRELTAKAKQDAKDPTLRMAILDNSSIGRELKGRLNDDIIRAGAGNDTLYGDAGDDILFGDEGNDTIYGGPGNDFLDGGTGADRLFGGIGDDFIKCRPGISGDISGGEGTDTLQLNADFFATGSVDGRKALVLSSATSRYHVYVDLAYSSNDQHGRCGIALGALLRGPHMLDNPIVWPGFVYNSNLAREVVDLFKVNSAAGEEEDDVIGTASSDIEDAFLWYLCEVDRWKYFTDGQSVYRARPPQFDHGSVQKSLRLNIQEINRAKRVYDEQVGYMEYKDSELEAALLFAFGSAGVSGIENITGADDSEKHIEVHAQIIGNENLRMVDLKGGGDEYVYTGDGNTVVLCMLSPTRTFGLQKYIHGGSGQNTLIIQGSDLPVVVRGTNLNQVILLDHHLLQNLPSAKREQNACNTALWARDGTRVDRAIFIKNMETIEFSAAPDSSSPFLVDAVNLSEGNRFIIDSGVQFKLIGSAGDDQIFIKTMATTTCLIDGGFGVNTLSLEEYQPYYDNIHIDLGTKADPGFIRCSNGTHSVFESQLTRVRNVRGSCNVYWISGHDDEDNLLMADKGRCTIEARGGKNTMVARRGSHTLIGGPGQDSYEIHGPDVTDFVVVTVTKRKHVGIVASCAKHSFWSRGTLIIYEIEGILTFKPGSVKVVDGQGNEVSGKGHVSYSGHTIRFSPGSDFAHVEVNRIETVRISFTTQKSVVTIKDSSPGNRIKLLGVEKSALHAKIGSLKQLQFHLRDRHHTPIWNDDHWRELYENGVTNLTTLVEDFTTRFPVIQFKSTGETPDVMEKKKVYEFLIAQLSRYTRPILKYDIRFPQESPLLDSIFDTKTSLSNVIQIGKGTHFVMGRRRKAKYSCTSEEGDVILDMTEIGDQNSSHGTEETTAAEAKKGDVLVAVNASCSEPVHTTFGTQHARSGTKILVVFGALPKDVTARSLTGSGDLKRQLETNSNVFLCLDDTPDTMMFIKGSGEQKKQVLVDDVDTFWTEKLANRAYISRRVYDSKMEQLLDISKYSEPLQFSLSITVRDGWLDVRLLEKGMELYACPVLWKSNTSIDAIKVAQSFNLDIPRGFKLKDETWGVPQIREAIMKCFRDGNYEITNAPEFDRVVYSSKQSFHYTVPAGSSLIFADRKNAHIYGGDGNNIIKVVKSNTTVNPGHPLHEGYSVIFIEKGVTQTTIQKQLPIGKVHLIIDGLAYSNLKYVWRDNHHRIIKYGETHIVECNLMPEVVLICQPLNGIAAVRDFTSWEMKGAGFEPILVLDEELQDVINTTAASLVVENIDIDPSIITPEKLEAIGLNSPFPVVVSGVTYPEGDPFLIPDYYRHLWTIPEAKVALTWKGATFYPFNYGGFGIFFELYKNSEWGPAVTAGFCGMKNMSVSPTQGVVVIYLEDGRNFSFRFKDFEEEIL